MCRCLWLNVPERFPIACFFFCHSHLFFLLGELTYISRTSQKRNRLGQAWDVCGGRFFAHPITPSRVRSCFDFVELGGDMSSKFQVDAPAGTGNIGWHRAGANSHHALNTDSMYDYIWYVQLPGSPVACLYVPCANVRIHCCCDVPRTFENIRLYECVRTICDTYGVSTLCDVRMAL